MQALGQDAKAALQSLRLALQSVCGLGPKQSVPAPQACELPDSSPPGPVLSPAAQAEMRDQPPTWVPLQRNLWLAPKPKKLARAQIHVRQLGVQICWAPGMRHSVYHLCTASALSHALSVPGWLAWPTALPEPTTQWHACCKVLLPSRAATPSAWMLLVREPRTGVVLPAGLPHCPVQVCICDPPTQRSLLSTLSARAPTQRQLVNAQRLQGVDPLTKAATQVQLPPDPIFQPPVWPQAHSGTAAAASE